VQPHIVQFLPKTIQLLFGSGILMTSLSAVLLNWIFNSPSRTPEMPIDRGLNENDSDK
ncbi:MAG TPA: Uric acid permease PucJ, partial [Lactobacillus sp.]|nr:Uric acid permease PucJ [Lactobacillus sp.]